MVKRSKRDQNKPSPGNIERGAQDPEAVDEEVKDIFEQAQELDYGRQDLQRKLKAYTDRTPKLTGGDVDAAWEYADVGEETVGGQNPTPDQSIVDEEGEAVGLTYQDNEPLAVDDKVGERDREPWELNPASSPDYGERVKVEFHSPLEKPGTRPEQDATTHRDEGKGKPRSPRTPRAGKSRPRTHASARALGAARGQGRGPGKSAKAARTKSQISKGKNPGKVRRTRSGRRSTPARR